MSTQNGRVLVVDDDVPMCDLLRESLSRREFDVRAVNTPIEAVECLRTHDYDALLTDLNMPGCNGIALCHEALSIRPGMPVVVLTAFGSLESAIAAIRAGAYDFLTKPVDIEVIALALGRAVTYARLRTDLRRLREQVAAQHPPAALVGESPVMRRVYDLIRRVSTSDVSVLLTGEVGTGKALAARALHDASAHRTGDFVAAGWAAMPEPWIDGELFGVETGSVLEYGPARAGALERAARGTLHIEQVADLPLGVQGKLVHVLRQRTFRRIGGREDIPFDARVIASTHRDLPAAVEDGRFRDDLYFLLNVLELNMPPLRSRGNDILLLAQRSLERHASAACKPISGFATDVAHRLLAYDWPGNLRELDNCMQRAVALARFDRITLDDLPDGVRSFRASHVLVVADDASELVTLEEVERRYVLRVLNELRGNRTAAARVLGLDRKTLQRKLARWEQPPREA